MPGARDASAVRAARPRARRRRRAAARPTRRSRCGSPRCSAASSSTSSPARRRDAKTIPDGRRARARATPSAAIDIDDALRVFDPEVPPRRSARRSASSATASPAAGTASTRRSRRRRARLPGAPSACCACWPRRRPTSPASCAGRPPRRRDARAAVATSSPGSARRHRARRSPRIDAAGSSLDDALAARRRRRGATPRGRSARVRPVLDDAAAIARALEPGGRDPPGSLAKRRLARCATATPVDASGRRRWPRRCDQALVRRRRLLAGPGRDRRDQGAAAARTSRRSAARRSSASARSSRRPPTRSCNCNAPALWMRNLAVDRQRGRRAAATGCG